MKISQINDDEEQSGELDSQQIRQINKDKELFGELDLARDTQLSVELAFRTQ